MSTDEKYLFALRLLKNSKHISWESFLGKVYQFNPTKPEHIFLLLHKKGWIYIKAYQPAIDKLKLDMTLGYTPSFNHLYFNITRQGLLLIESLTYKELLNNNKQFKLDI